MSRRGPRTRVGHVLALKEAVRERDGMRCTQCGLTNADHVARTSKSLHVHRLRPGSRYTVEGCVTLCVTCHGAAPKRQDGEVDLEVHRQLAKMDADVVRKAQIVAASKGITLAEYLSELCRPLVERDMVRLAKETLKGDSGD